MKQKQFFFALLMALLTVMLLSMIWEFWLEDLIAEIHGGEYTRESRQERWEYVTTVFIFSLVSLIYPALLGRKAIIAHQRLYDKYLRSSREDYLTGLHNRRQLSESLSNEIHRCTRYSKTFSLIMLDIDDFKQTNDQFGHLAGDGLLKQIADLLREETRSSDLAGRWGGEEFLIICPETDAHGASSLAEKIRNRLQRSDFGRIGRKTASLGVASFEPGDDLESIVRRADDALYWAKQAGKNRVKIAASRSAGQRPRVPQTSGNGP